MATTEIKQNAALVPVSVPDTSGNLVFPGDLPNQAVRVNVVASGVGAGGDGAILDGVSSSIKATVFDRTNSNPLATQLVDSNGDPVSVGGGTQYDQGTATTDTDALTMAGAVRRDTAAVATGVANGDRTTLSTDGIGQLRIAPVADVTATGSVSALDETVTLSVQGRIGIGLLYETTDLNGGFILEGSNDGGVTWAEQELVFYRGGEPLDNYGAGGFAETLEFSVMPMSAMTHVRVRVNDYNSGSATFTLRGGQSSYNPMTSAAFASNQPATGGPGLVVREVARGQATMTASIPVVIASDQSAVPISGTVSVNEPVTVDATDLDIRNLVFATDKVDASGSTGVGVTGPLTDAELRATPVPVSGTVSVTEPVTVDAVDLDIRNLVFATDKVDISGSSSVGVTGTTFDGIIRDGAGDTTQANVSSGRLHVDGSGVTQPVSGTVTANAGTGTFTVGGVAAHDVAVSGNPVLVAASSETMADSAPANRTTADGEVMRLSATDGAQYVITTGPQTWSYHENSSSQLTDTSVHASPGSGLSLYVTDIVVSTGAATAFNIFFEEGASTVLGPWYLEAVNGRGLVVHFGTPKKITAATALTVTTSAAIAHSIDITGFIAPG